MPHEKHHVDDAREYESKKAKKERAYQIIKSTSIDKAMKAARIVAEEFDLIPLTPAEMLNTSSPEERRLSIATRLIGLMRSKMTDTKRYEKMQKQLDAAHCARTPKEMIEHIEYIYQNMK